MEANRLGPLRILRVFVGLDLFLFVLVGMRAPWPALVLSGGVGLLLGLLACRYLRNTWDPVTLSSHAEDRPIRDTGIIVLMIFGLSMLVAGLTGLLAGIAGSAAFSLAAAVAVPVAGLAAGTGIAIGFSVVAGFGVGNFGPLPRWKESLLIE
jgi:hypothetical protein